VDHTVFSNYEMREMAWPSNGWTVPMITGHRYRFHWQEGLDFEQMRVETKTPWEETDLNLYMMTNFTDIRASINMTESTTGTLIANETYLLSDADLVNGDNIIYNQTEVREFNFVLNGKNPAERSSLIMTGYRCVVNCEPEAVEEEEISGD
jgi:hypothetical protein